MYYSIVKKSKNSFIIKGITIVTKINTFKKALEELPESCRKLQLINVNETKIVLPNYITHLLVNGSTSFKKLPKELKILQLFNQFTDVDLGYVFGQISPLPNSFSKLKHLEEFKGKQKKMPTFPDSIKYIDLRTDSPKYKWIDLDHMKIDPPKPLIIDIPSGVEQLKITTDFVQFPDLSKFPNLKVLQFGGWNINSYPRNVNKKIHFKQDEERPLEMPKKWLVESKTNKWIEIGTKWKYSMKR
jgi:hypothetical protein